MPAAEDLGLVPATCLAENLTDSVRNGVQVPEPTIIPDGFIPAGAITCDLDRSVGVVDHALSLVEMRHGGDLTAVLAAYAVPSDPRDMTCHVGSANATDRMADRRSGTRNAAGAPVGTVR